MIKSKEEIKHVIKELELNQEILKEADTSDYPEEFINKGWIEALRWVLQKGTNE